MAATGVLAAGSAITPAEGQGPSRAGSSAGPTFAGAMDGGEEQTGDEGEVVDEEAELGLVASQCDGPWKAKARNST